MITEVDDANDSATSKITWTKERDIALLGQIVKVGKAAFETNRGGGKSKDGNKQLTQEQIWAGPGGIVSVLKQDYGHLFQGVKWPSTQSVINHITHKQSGLIFKFKHLYTSGMEQERSDSEHIASTVASLSMVASKRRMADELREDLREALDAGDISLQVYLKEMKKLRVCAITNDSSDGTSAIRTPKAAATSELHRVVESDSPGSADDPEKLSDAEASEPEDDDASSNRDVDDKEGAPASATRTSNATTAFTLSVGDRAMHNARGEVRVEKIGIERDFLNHGRVYISYQKRKSGCKRKMEVNYVWVDRMSLKAIEAWKEKNRLQPIFLPELPMNVSAQ
ncbi:hypothetical protein AB1Y20_018082 [Prymnesium parvum]|uniref:Uncharacterized protein n=1 Tax=Prymnesium parvum TaxID=97485 RepID=A0AB34JR58_PRYPA